MAASFFNLYRHGFVRVVVGVPTLRVADPAFNAARTIELLRQAHAQRAAVALFPELGLTAYTCDDLFHQRALLDACEAALDAVLAASASLPTVAVVGMPLRVDQRLFNVAVVLQRPGGLMAVHHTVGCQEQLVYGSGRLCFYLVKPAVNTYRHLAGTISRHQGIFFFRQPPAV